MISIPKLIDGINLVQRKLSQLVVTQDDSCFVVGLTGSAKSTLLAYLGEANITWSRNKNGNYILSHNRPDLPVIGNQLESCTDIPTLFKFPNQTLFFYDSPGFLETRGAMQEILNSYCNAKMFKLGSKAKIVIMVEFYTLKSARGTSLVDVAKRLRELFRNQFWQVLNSCLLVVSKINSEDDTLQNVTELINDISQQNKSLEPEGIMLLKTLLVNKRIILFPLPKLISNDTISKIKAEIIKLPTFGVSKEPCISLSPEAKNCIEEVVKHCEKEKSELAYKIGRQILNSFNIEGNKETIQASLLNIRKAKQMLMNKEIESGIPQKLNEFKQILGLGENQMKGLKQWMSQIKFCLTIYHQLKVSTKLSEILLMHIVQSERHLEGILQQLTTRQEMNAINETHKAEMIRQRETFSNEVIQMRNRMEMEKRQFIERAEKESRIFQDRMRQINLQHAREMEALNQRISPLQSCQNNDSSSCQLI